MDRRILGLLILAIVASGCALPSSSTNDPGNGDSGPDLAEDRGLQIEAFRTTDETLRPSQPAVVNLRLKNYHTADINITDISIYNEGLLEVSNKRCTPSPEDLRPASGGNYPEMECQWDLEAPEEDAYGSFESKPASMNLHLEYESALTNQKPFKVEFKPLDEINTSSDLGKTFSNSEVSMTVSTENPVPLESGRTIEVSAHEIGQGRIASGSNYSFKFTPDDIFGEDCNRDDSPIVGKEVTFSCHIGGEDVQQGTRNLIFSTYYKYVKEPVLNIKLVNNQ